MCDRMKTLRQKEKKQLGMRHMQIKVELNPKTFYLHNKKLSQHGRQTWHYCVGWGGMSAHQGPFWSTITKKKQWSQCSTEYYSRCEKEKKTATQKINFCTTQVVKTKRNDTKINKKDTKIHRMKTKWWHLFACVQYFTGPWLLYVKNKTRLGNLASVFCEPSPGVTDLPLLYVLLIGYERTHINRCWVTVASEQKWVFSTSGCRSFFLLWLLILWISLA